MKGLKNNKIRYTIFLLSLSILLYIYNPYKIEYFGHQSKVWAHRVNTLEKLSYTEKFYFGIELDVVFDSIKNNFDVNHPPDKSIGLDLDLYFSKIENKNIKLWLDFKNLSKSNAIKSSVILDRLAAKNNLNNQNILVESEDVISLEYFKFKNFKTLFYLPPLVDLNNRSHVLINRIDSISLLLKKYPTSGISSHTNSYNVLNSYFKNEKKFLWSTDEPYSRHQIRNYRKFRTYICDPNVEVMLIKVALPVGNR